MEYSLNDAIGSDGGQTAEIAKLAGFIAVDTARTARQVNVDDIIF